MIRGMTTNYIEVAKESLEDAQQALESIVAEHQGLKRSHRIADLHLDHRHACQTGRIAALTAIAEQMQAVAVELQRIGLGR